MDSPSHIRCILKDALCKDAENFQNSEMQPFVGIVKGKRTFPLTASFVTFLCGQKSKCRQAKLSQRIGIDATGKREEISHQNADLSSSQPRTIDDRPYDERKVFSHSGGICGTLGKERTTKRTVE